MQSVQINKDAAYYYLEAERIIGEVRDHAGVHGHTADVLLAQAQWACGVLAATAATHFTHLAFIAARNLLQAVASFVERIAA